MKHDRLFIESWQRHLPSSNAPSHFPASALSLLLLLLLLWALVLLEEARSSTTRVDSLLA